MPTFPRRPPSSSGAGPVPPGTMGLMIALVAVSVLSVLSVGGGRLGGELALYAPLVLRGHLWSLLTYGFLETNPVNILFSLIGLYFIGSAMEQRWGTRRLVTYYLVMTMLCGAVAVLLSLVWPAAGGPHAGSWTALTALTAAFALEMPDATIMFGFFVPLRGQQLLWVLLGMLLLFAVFSGLAPFVPQFAALGFAVLHARGYTRPSRTMARVRLAWLEYRLKRRRLRLVDEITRPPKDGSSKYLH